MNLQDIFDFFAVWKSIFAAIFSKETKAHSNDKNSDEKTYEESEKAPAQSLPKTLEVHQIAIFSTSSLYKIIKKCYNDKR